MTKYRDDVCRLGKCKNHPCGHLCAPLIFIDGNIKSKEVLLSNFLTSPQNLAYKNYNETIAELSEYVEIREKRRTEKLESILSEPNTREKLIKLALLAHYSQQEIAKYFRLTEARISQIIKNAP
ncbi:MAG: hypothetical protein WC332_02210 [Clostridia bacterium]